MSHCIRHSVRPPRRRSFLFLILALCPLLATAAAEPVGFNRDIRPLLGDNCLACHGPDPAARKADLRLDTHAGLFEPTDDRGPTVTPGDLEKSELWYRISTPDGDDLMPPPDSHKELTPDQIELFKTWILQGAPWEDHWAFIAPERPEVPDVESNGSHVRNPIDAFVIEQLEERGLRMNPEADRRTLARRLALDLTGLPPTPEQVDAFERDASPDYFETYVNALMATDAWGEHRGRYWLDAARYADTHGLHFDNYREMWPYRDWVIAAFNENMPFDQFAVEQLAGDLLENPTDDQLIATGFQRCNITTNEGGTIEEENLANYAGDRVTTTGWVFMGLTTNCSACHDHKFDPLTQKDYYSLAAFFRNTKQSGFDRNWREGDLFMVVPQSEADNERWEELPGELTFAEATRELRDEYVEPAFERWWKRTARWNRAETLDPAPTFGDEHLRVTFNGTEVNAVLEARELEAALPVETRVDDRGPLGAAPVLNAEHNIDLGDVGDFERGQPFSVAAWVYLPEDFDGDGSIVARMGGGEVKNRGWDFFIAKDTFGMHLVNSWPMVALKKRSADKTLTKGEWQHVTATYNGGGRAEDVALYVNGRKVGDRAEQNRLEYSIRVDVPLRIGRRETDFELDDVAVQDVRIYRRALDPSEVMAVGAGPNIPEFIGEAKELFSAKSDAVLQSKKYSDELRKQQEKALKEKEFGDASDEEKPEPDEETKLAIEKAKKAAEELTAAADRIEYRRAALRGYFRRTQFSPTRDAIETFALLRGEKDAIAGRSPVTHIQREKENSEPTAHILNRGQYDQPGEKVTADTPGFLPPLPEDAPRNRLGLARWIVAPENPLFARVTVNRFWQEVFGVGLVETVEDFGVVGTPPVNEELLDWLAVEFRESGWDVKHLFRLMVTSAAYRQTATITPEKLDRDPANRYLSRAPRFRMDAEMIRDQALAASGLLVKKVGGPSVRPYQPGGVWEAVAMPESNTRFYERGDDSELYRRSLYTFWKRAAPPATMDVFNAPSRETCTVRRERTNTPLQALATMNDPQFVEAARVLAERALIAADGDTEKAVDELSQRLLLRSLSERERSIVFDTFKETSTYYETQPDAARELLAVGEAEPTDALPVEELAAFTLVANQLMNLDEVLNK